MDRFLGRSDLQSLFDALATAGYRILGPRLREGAIVLAEMHRAGEIPAGLHDLQSPGHYQVQRSGERLFDWANGPQALKPLCFAPHESLWRSERTDEGRLRFVELSAPAVPTAVIGVRGCDLAALALQDAHFLAEGAVDAHYRARRESLLLVAVHCSRPAATCFCASTGDGPRAGEGYDLALHELEEGFLLDAGSARGQRIAERLPLSAASAGQLARAEDDWREATEAQTRALPSRDLSEALFAHLEHPRWDDVAGRCLACGNCTSVCPTCFCNDLAETPALDGMSSETVRRWGSCYTEGHSYYAGHVLRDDVRLRYRQWLTHKLGAWHAQYGRSGCTGCGRCITWCPVGIDITEEAGAICGGGG